MVTIFPKLTNPHDNYQQPPAEILEMIKSDLELKPLIDEIRNPDLTKDQKNEIKKKLPCITWSGTFSKRQASALIRYSGIICLDIDDAIPDLKNDPYVWASFISPSGNGLKVLIKTNGTSDDHLNNFLAIQEYFKDTHGIELDQSGKDLARACFASHDPELYINENAEIWTTQTPLITSAPTPTRSAPKSSDENIEIILKWWQKNHPYVQGNRNSAAFILACALFRAGTSMPDVSSTVRAECHGLDDRELQTTISSADRTTVTRDVEFKDNEFTRTFKVVRAPVTIKDQETGEESDIFVDVKSLTQEMVAGLMKREGYSFRYDEITHITEFRAAGEKKYRCIEENDFSKMWGRLDSILKNEFGSKKELSVRVFQSAMSIMTHSHHPIKEFFQDRKWNGVPQVDSFLACFQDKYGAADEYLKFFMLGSIERLFKTFQNPVLVLDGEQAIGKSYLVRWLSQPFFDYYKEEGSIDPSSKDSKIELTQNFIFEWGEAKGFSRREVESLKSLIFTSYITERLPYAKNSVRRPMISNIIMTKNSSNGGFLKDLTGSRRFHTLFLTKIDQIYSNLDVEQLWLEFYHLWQEDKEGSWKTVNAERKSVIDEEATDDPHVWAILDEIIEVTENEYDSLSTVKLYRVISEIDKTFKHMQQHQFVTAWFKKKGIEKTRRCVGTDSDKKMVFPGAVVNLPSEYER